jgi:hypothetical protein
VRTRVKKATAVRVRIVASPTVARMKVPAMAVSANETAANRSGGRAIAAANSCYLA